MNGFEFGGRVVAEGTRETINLDVSTLANATPMNLRCMWCTAGRDLCCSSPALSTAMKSRASKSSDGCWPMTR